jgi:oxepin-CoA hydrolase/3-oxo-5,6-dehydrosuberyl-CoA semialdehyde dehydrogenase
MNPTSTLTLEPHRIAEAKRFLQTTIPAATAKFLATKKPLWGKMTAQHMIEHLYTAVVSSTIIKKTPPIPANPRQEEFKNILVYSLAPMGKNLDNPAFRFGLPDYTNPSIIEAKAKLLSSLERFFEVYEGKDDAYNFNIFLGDLHTQETLLFHYKHFKHHYTQFGLI